MAGTRFAGVAVPLFSLGGPPDDSGVGEFGDLAAFFEWAAAAGQSVVALLPLGELAPGESSPYNALSTFALDPVHLTVQALPELSGAGVVPPARAAARAGRRRV